MIKLNLHHQNNLLVWSTNPSGSPHSTFPGDHSWMIGDAGLRGRSGSAACCCVWQRAFLQMKREKTYATIHWRVMVFSVDSAVLNQCDELFFSISGAEPESLMCLRASLSEKEDISFGDLWDIFSKSRKGTLLQYTTSSDSSGLSFEQTTWEG